MRNPRGSMWNKWDLHIHTPASFHWTKGKLFMDMSPKEENEALKSIINKMKQCDVAVFGVMDYWTFDGYLKIRGFISNHSDLDFQKTILPGMELRIESPTAYRLNAHVLLSNNLTTQELSDFKSGLKIRVSGKQLNLSDEALIKLAASLDSSTAKEHGFGKDDLKDHRKLLLLGAKTAVITRESFQSACDLLPDGKLVIIFPYSTSDGLAGMDWRKHGHETSELLKLADYFETRNNDHINLFMGIKNSKNEHFIDEFQTAIGGFPKPVLSGSDAHTVEDYGNFPNGKASWLKSDTTWEGIRIVMCEPVERVFIGPIPPQIKRIEANRTKYMKKLNVRKRDGSQLEEVWFDNDIPLNNGLVAIIGNKGSGKTALTDILGLLGNSKRQEWFHFLHEAQFRQPKMNKAAEFEAVLTWESEKEIQANLNDDVNPSTDEAICYIPQDCFEEICNELKSGSDSRFNQELSAVIFSHVSESDRLGKASIDELIEFKTAEINRGIEYKRLDLRKINEEIVGLEKRRSKEHIEKITDLLGKKQEEHEARKQIRPETVRKPRAKTAKAKRLNEKIADCEQQKNALKRTLDNASTEKNKIAIRSQQLTNVLNSIRNLKKQFDDFERNNKSILLDSGIEFTDVVSLTINEDPITAKLTELTEQMKKYDSMLNLDDPKSHASKIASLEVKITKLQEELDEPNQKYVKFLKELEEWNDAVNEIVGSKAKPDTLKYYENQLSELEQIPQMLAKKEEERNGLAKQIHSEIRRVAKMYGELHKRVQEFISTHPLARDKFNLVFDVSIRNKDFQSRFFRFIHQGKTGSFYNVEEGGRLLDDILNKYDFGQENDAIEFVNEVMHNLHTNIKTGQPNDIQSQLISDSNPTELYDLIFSFIYLEPNYSLKMGERMLSELSPGQKGTLLLIFYLLIDFSDIPLIIDQPEHNLDNETIFDLMVLAIKEAKKSRQIILVTHNPNIAVVCDADQIIYASLDKTAEYKIKYLSGAIENPEISRHIVNVLEGTMPAFDNRSNKYEIMPQVRAKLFT